VALGVSHFSATVDARLRNTKTGNRAPNLEAQQIPHLRYGQLWTVNFPFASLAARILNSSDANGVMGT